jgi:hypothetical protein
VEAQDLSYHSPAGGFHSSTWLWPTRDVRVLLLCKEPHAFFMENLRVVCSVHLVSFFSFQKHEKWIQKRKSWLSKAIVCTWSRRLTTQGAQGPGDRGKED